MFSVAPVCQFVCQFQVCQFVCLFVRTITFERFNIRWWNLALRCIAQKSRASSNVKVEGQRSRGQKTKKCGILFRRLGHGPSPVLRRWKKSAQKICEFRQITRYISNTVQDTRTVSAKGEHEIYALCRWPWVILGHITVFVLGRGTNRQTDGRTPD